MLRQGWKRCTNGACSAGAGASVFAGASACAAAAAEGVSADLCVSSVVESGFEAQRDCSMMYNIGCDCKAIYSGEQRVL
jgi:hypothetical protein